MILTGKKNLNWTKIILMEEKDTITKISKGKKWKFIFSTLVFLSVVIIIITEILLYFFHYDSTYNRMQNFTLEQAKWWTCDSVSGPRYVANQLDKTDSEYFKDQLWYYNRLKIVNNEGYHDRDDFKELSTASDS